MTIASIKKRNEEMLAECNLMGPTAYRDTHRDILLLLAVAEAAADEHGVTIRRGKGWHEGCKVCDSLSKLEEAP